MSKILAIIAEYNPFHNGHLYQLEEAKKIVNPDFTVCIMSGNFVERGNTAIVNKWSRAEMVLQYGVDLVIELPTVYSISSAENFALGAIKILNNLPGEVYLSFGSEIGDVSPLSKIVEVLTENPAKYSSMLEHELNKGISFPKARENALLMYLGDISTYAPILSSPNDILAIEYLKSIKLTNSKIMPVPIKRHAVNYNDLETTGIYASATAIRKMILNDENFKDFMPKDAYSIFSKELNYGRFVEDISKLTQVIIYKLRTMSLDEIENLADVTEGLENRIKEAVNSCNDIDTLLSSIKTKRYTLTRISRILLYALLDITKDDISVSHKINPYIRVLGISEKGKSLLSEISQKNKKAKVITSVKKFLDDTKRTSANLPLINMLEKDILATNIYTLGYEYDSKSNLDYTQKLITI